MPVSAGDQAEVFNNIITRTLGDDCCLEDVRNIHENVSVMLRQYDNSEPEPLTLGKEEVKKLFEKSGLSNEVMRDFGSKFDEAVKETLEEDEDEAANTRIRAANIAGVKKFDIKTPDVVIKVNPERIDLIETRVIDGKQCLVIAVNDRVEVNGLSCRTMGGTADA